MHFLRRYPRVRGGLRVVKHILRPVSSLRRQGQDRVYHNLNQRLRGDAIMALPEFGGEFSIDVRSDVFRRLVMNGYYEPHLAACCRRFAFPERDAIDVGANVGFYSVLLAGSLGPGRRVLAIEPESAAVTRLRQNILRNGVSKRVLIHEGVVSEEDGPYELATVDGKSEYSTLGRLVHPSVAAAEGRTVRVEGTRLDVLVHRLALDPGLIKIDVEGAELKVLRGATRLLTEMRPCMLVEVHRYILEETGEAAEEVLGFLREHRYRLFDPERFDKPAVWKQCFSVLCLPEDRDCCPAK